MANTDKSIRCGIDTVQLARIERLLNETPPADRERIFSAAELSEAGPGASSVASLAARFAAKEACLKLLPRETALGEIGPHDFSICRNGYGEPAVTPSPLAQAILDHYRLEPIAISLTHDSISASAVAMTSPRKTPLTTLDRLAFRLFPVRRQVVFANLRRAFGGKVSEDEIAGLARASYGHLARSLGELVRVRFMSAERRRRLVRVENIEPPLKAWQKGHGMLFLTGHFGNWELTSTAAAVAFPQFHGRFHVIRKRLPLGLDAVVGRRFTRVGINVISSRGGLQMVPELLARGDGVVFVFDQNASARDGIMVDFFGEPASTFRSLATIALGTGAPVTPCFCYRNLDGTHVLRFEDPLETIDTGDFEADLRANTRSYNAVLERIVCRHPEQWFWMHRRWKGDPRAKA
jgi:phosphopantetheine--protein transferase-like protein